MTWECRHCGEPFERVWKGWGTKPSVCPMCTNRRGCCKPATAEQRKAINARYRAKLKENRHVED